MTLKPLQRLNDLFMLLSVYAVQNRSNMSVLQTLLSTNSVRSKTGIHVCDM